MRPTGALLLIVVSAAFAADPQEPAPGSIDEAKKDLAAIKTLSTPALQGTAALPVLDMKSISPGPGGGSVEAPPPLATEDASTLDPSRRKEGTGNWLVDAMEKKPDGATGSRGREAVSRGDASLMRDGERTGARPDPEDQSQGDPRDRPASREAPGAAFNPLDSFMSGWISSRDHDLLVPATRGDATASGDLSKSRAANLPDFDLGQPGDPAEGGFAPLEAPAWTDSRQAVNPYLAAMDLIPVASPRGFSSPDMPDPSTMAFRTLPALSGVDPASLDSARSFIPDFAQPPDDDKYFKQMKKF